ncbi:DMT family protein [soil metagenome]
MLTIVLLIISNIFMTIAWYGHLRFKSSPIWIIILVSWGIALFEYCFHVPANRIGHRTFSASQLKVMQEVITLVVFCGFAVTYLKEPLRWNYVVGFLLILAAVAVVFGFDARRPSSNVEKAPSTPLPPAAGAPGVPARAT